MTTSKQYYGLCQNDLLSHMQQKIVIGMLP